MSSCKCVVCGDMFNRDIVQPISVCKKCRDKSLQAFDKWAEEIRKKKTGDKENEVLELFDDTLPSR